MRSIIKNRFFKVFIIFILSFNISFLTFTSVKQETARAYAGVVVPVGVGVALVACAMVLGVTFTSSEEIAIFTDGVIGAIDDYRSSVEELKDMAKMEVVKLMIREARFKIDLYNIIKNYIDTMNYTMPYPQENLVYGSNPISYSVPSAFFDIDRTVGERVIARIPLEGLTDLRISANSVSFGEVKYSQNFFKDFSSIIREFGKENLEAAIYLHHTSNTTVEGVDYKVIAYRAGLYNKTTNLYHVPSTYYSNLCLNYGYSGWADIDIKYSPYESLILDGSLNGLREDVDVSSLKDSQVGSLDEALNGKVKEGFGVLVPPVVGGLSADLPWTRENIGVLFPDISKDKALSWEDAAVKDVVIENVDGDVISIPGAAEGDVTFPFISGLRSLLLSLFVPGDDYFISFFNEMKENFESKLSVSDFTSIFDSDYSSRRLDNITFPYKGREYVILSFDFFYDNRDAFDKWSRAFFFVLLAIFNYNQIYRIFRSSSYVTSSTFTTSDKK